MKFYQIFKASLHEPKKLAAFRMLSVGKVFSYVFVFVALFTIISFIRFSVGDITFFDNSPELLEHSKAIGWLIYPMAFLLQLVISIFYIFLRISIFAYIGAFMLRVTKRRGDYFQIWRTGAVAMTIPILLTIALDFFPSTKSYSLLVTSIIHLLYIGASLKYYPKQRR